MKNLILIVICIIFSFNAIAEYSFDKSFPNEIHGSWSDNCNESQYLIIIYDYGTLEIWLYDDYSNIELSISKVANINGWIANKNKSDDIYPFNFLKYQNGQIVQKIPPNDWNGIEYEFLSDPTYEAYQLKKCEKINSEISLLFEPIIEISNSNLPKLCFHKFSDSKECFQNIVEYLDITNDYTLSSAEITRGIKTVILYLYLTSSNNLTKDAVIGAKLLSFALTPTLSELLILNYDFDNSKSLSVNELEFAFTDLNEGKNIANNSFKNLNVNEIIETLYQIFD